jgi:membrane-associated protein
MKRIIFLLSFIVIMVPGVFAADSLRINLINQYKQVLENEKIMINNVEHTSDAAGNVTLALPLADTLSITLKDYSVKIFPTNEIKQNSQLVLDKDFAWTDLLTPMFYILYGGLWLLLFIIFAETGLFVGFFFPGDSLLFVAGILSTPLVDSISLNTGNDFFNLLIISALCSIAGILGNTVGYFTGRKVGPAMYNWKDRLLFKKRYLHQAKDFYDKHGGGAIVFARFLPLVRTFAPIVAGIVNMDKKKFSFYNIIGCIAWVVSMLFMGHYLNEFTKKQLGIDLEKHLEIIVIGIVLVTTAPVLIKLFFRKKKKPADESSEN